jgi:hypothetical protein
MAADTNKKEFSSDSLVMEKYRVLLKPLCRVMNDVPGAATLYEDILHANEIIKSFMGSVHTRVQAVCGLRMHSA